MATVAALPTDATLAFEASLPKAAKDALDKAVKASDGAGRLSRDLLVAPARSEAVSRMELDPRNKDLV
eukprot:912417-Alexandrium_andersonii.AAC.1